MTPDNIHYNRSLDTGVHLSRQKEADDEGRDGAPFIFKDRIATTSGASRARAW